MDAVKQTTIHAELAASRYPVSLLNFLIRASTVVFCFSSSLNWLRILNTETLGNNVLQIQGIKHDLHGNQLIVLGCAERSAIVQLWKLPLLELQSETLVQPDIVSYCLLVCT